MKLITAKQDFKAVRETAVKRFPALASKIGQKRKTVEFQLPEYEIADLPELSANHGALLLTCFNAALANLAKDLFAEKADDWNYSPSAEDLSPSALAASFEKVSRGRVLTLESAGKLAAWITANMHALLAGIKVAEPTYQPAQLSAIAVVIGKYTAYESKGADYLAKVITRLDQIAEAIAGNDELAASFTEDSALPSVFDALRNKFAKVGDDEIDADAL